MKSLHLFLATAILGATAFVLPSCSGNSSQQDEPVIDTTSQRSRPAQANADLPIPLLSGSNCLFVDEAGADVFGKKFAEASAFSETDALALVRSHNDQKWGYINPQGDVVIQEQYDAATCFSEGFAWVKSAGKISCIKADGSKAFDLPNAVGVKNFSEGLAAFAQMVNGKKTWGFIDNAGNIKIAPAFADADKFSEGHAAVATPGKNKSNQLVWNYINTDGKSTYPDGAGVNRDFAQANVFVNQTAAVKKGGKFYLLDEFGRYKVTQPYNNLTENGMMFMAENNGRWGWISNEPDAAGHAVEVIKPQYDSAFLFGKNDFAAVKMNNEYIYIDGKGTQPIKAAFAKAYPFHGGHACVLVNGNIQLIDTGGTLIIPAVYCSDVARDLQRIFTTGRSMYEGL
jgi:hypothetical protein